MPRNVEIKARISSGAALLPRALAFAEDPPQLIHQDDTFFNVPHGRLKLRVYGHSDGHGVSGGLSEDVSGGRPGRAERAGAGGWGSGGAGLVRHAR